MTIQINEKGKINAITYQFLVNFAIVTILKCNLQ